MSLEELNKEIEKLQRISNREYLPLYAQGKLDAYLELLPLVKKLTLTDVVRSKTLESKIANKRQRIKGDLQNAKNIINGNKGMSSDYIIDKTRNMPFLRCKLNLIDELLEN